MSVALTADRVYTRNEYRLWLENQPRGRFERVDGRIVAMAAERIAHVRTKQAVYQALEKAVAVAGVSCEAFSDGVTVEAGESDCEPDALVNCGPKLDGDAIAAPNPVIIVEVLSPSISSTDTGGKLAGYFSLTPVMHYLIMHATRPVIVHHRRSPLGIDTRIVVGGEITMDPPGITIDLDEI